MVFDNTFHSFKASALVAPSLTPLEVHSDEDYQSEPRTIFIVMLKTTTRRSATITVVRGTFSRVNPARHLPRAPLFLSRLGSNSIGQSTVAIITQGHRLYSTHITDHIKSKVWDDVDEAVADVKSGDVILSAGEFPILGQIHLRGVLNP